MPIAPVKSARSIRASLKFAPVRSAPRKKAPFRLPPLKNALSSRASEKFAFSAITPVSEAKLSVALTKLASLAFTPERSDWVRSACAKEACLSETILKPTPRRLAPLSDACSKEVLKLALAESIIALSSDVNSKLAPCSVAERRLAPSSSAPEKSLVSSLELYRLAPRRSNSRKCVQPESMGAALGRSSRQHTQAARFWQCLPPPQTARRKRPASRLPGRLTEEYTPPRRGLTRQTTPSRGTILKGSSLSMAHLEMARPDAGSGLENSIAMHFSLFSHASRQAATSLSPHFSSTLAFVPSALRQAPCGDRTADRGGPHSEPA
mmetsp:Transcript_8568/g.26894  ORF Transcript_8568/g.26894 Transcript_8568/m.26894 type:complete len:322 (-) Transcript_8568:186-1151(-)